jgi:hypothetical protein
MYVLPNLNIDLFAELIYRHALHIFGLQEMCYLLCVSCIILGSALI